MAVTKHSKLDGFKQPTFILSQFWRPNVWHPGVGRAASEVSGADGSFASSSSCCQHFLACGHSLQSLPPSSCDLPFCPHLSSFVSYKDTCHRTSGPLGSSRMTSSPHQILNHICKHSFSIKAHVQQYWGLEHVFRPAYFIHLITLPWRWLGMVVQRDYQPINRDRAIHC